MDIKMDMPEKIWGLIHCGAHGWTDKEDVAKNAYVSRRYTCADLATAQIEGLQARVGWLEKLTEGQNIASDRLVDEVNLYRTENAKLRAKLEAAEGLASVLRKLIEYIENGKWDHEYGYPRMIKEALAKWRSAGGEK